MGKKLSRILTGVQDIKQHRYGKNSICVGEKNGFLYERFFFIPQISDYTQEKIAFYAGNPTERQNEIAGKLENLMENIDEVMSAKHRFMNISKE